MARRGPAAKNSRIGSGGESAAASLAPEYTAAEAAKLIAVGRAPEGMTVRGSLSWKESEQDLRLPKGLTCYSLDLTGQPVTTLPDDLHVQFKLSLRNCARLTTLPRGLTAGSIDLAGCTALESLPEDFDVSFLDISGCTQLREWPQSACLKFGRLRARNCTGLVGLPDWLKQISQLDISGCRQIAELPADLEVTSWIDLAGTGIDDLPSSWQGTPLRWRGVPIDRRIAFRPDEITADEILNEPNAESRRVKLERMGFERFIAQARAEVLDRDRDPGGERQLLRVVLDGDEPLVCVSVICPSTDRQYVIRVPPTMETCRQAVAWTAGFDNPDDYQPVQET